MLPYSKQQELVERFRQFLNSLNSGIRLVAKKSSKEIPIGDGDLYHMQFYRYFVESEENIDDRLSSFSLPYNRVSEIPSYAIVRKMSDRIILPEGKMVKTFTLYKLSSTLVEGFVSETYGIADEVSIVIIPIVQEQATAKMNKYTKFLSGMILADQQKHRTSPYELVQRYTMAPDSGVPDKRPNKVVQDNGEFRCWRKRQKGPEQECETAKKHSAGQAAVS